MDHNIIKRIDQINDLYEENLKLKDFFYLQKTALQQEIRELKYQKATLVYILYFCSLYIIVNLNKK
jgi:hypothetical protein